MIWAPVVCFTPPCNKHTFETACIKHTTVLCVESKEIHIKIVSFPKARSRCSLLLIAICCCCCCLFALFINSERVADTLPFGHSRKTYFVKKKL